MTAKCEDVSLLIYKDEKIDRIVLSYDIRMDDGSKRHYDFVTGMSSLPSTGIRIGIRETNKMLKDFIGKTADDILSMLKRFYGN